jgi:hypothetical protein
MGVHQHPPPGTHESLGRYQPAPLPTKAPAGTSLGRLQTNRSRRLLTGEPLIIMMMVVMVMTTKKMIMMKKINEKMMEEM